MSMRNLVRGWIGLVAALALAPAAGALQITGLLPAKNAGNTADSPAVSGNNGSQITSAAAISLAPGAPVFTVGQAIAFETRYTELLAIDRDNSGSAQTNTLNTDYSITFTVDNPTGATYRVDIDTLRAGALTVVDDTGGNGVNNGTVTLTAVTGRLDSIVNASLGLALVPSFTSGSTGMSSFDGTTGQSNTLSITDNALSRTFTLNFTWSSTATTNLDEAALRMGTSGGITSATADNYPGAGGLARTQSGDGHFVDVTTTIIGAPEPASGALVAFGLLGLAIGARWARARRR